MSYQDYTVLRQARLDTIAKLIFQTEREGTVEALLDANPGLSVLAMAVPRGTVIKVPVRPTVTTTSYTRPWE